MKTKDPIKPKQTLSKKINFKKEKLDYNSSGVYTIQFNLPEYFYSDYNIIPGFSDAFMSTTTHGVWDIPQSNNIHTIHRGTMHHRFVIPLEKKSMWIRIKSYLKNIYKKVMKK